MLEKRERKHFHAWKKGLSVSRDIKRFHLHLSYHYSQYLAVWGASGCPALSNTHRGTKAPAGLLNRQVTFAFTL